MEAFLFGITSILTFPVAIFVILSFILIGKLSTFFGSHLAKVAILSLTTVTLVCSFTLFFSPRSAHEILTGFAMTFLILTIVVCLNFLGVFKMIKSRQIQSNVEGVINWLTPFVFGYWLFTQSFGSFGPLIGSIILKGDFGVERSVELIPLFFGLGVIVSVGGLLAMSWFFHNKFKNMQFWKVIQVLAAVAVLILSLRLLIMIRLT